MTTERSAGAKETLETSGDKKFVACRKTKEELKELASKAVLEVDSLNKEISLLQKQPRISMKSQRGTKGRHCNKTAPSTAARSTNEEATIYDNK